MISGQAILAGVMGFPVRHSRSPALHNFWLARHGIDGAYVPLPVAPADFATALQGLRAAGFAGVNVTLPHKEAAFALCESVDESARRAGAVNTIVFSDSGVQGSNTDGYGFLANLAAHGVGANGPALLLGAGGAARAIAAALLDAGAKVSVCNRTRPGGRFGGGVAGAERNRLVACGGRIGRSGLAGEHDIAGHARARPLAVRSFAGAGWSGGGGYCLHADKDCTFDACTGAGAGGSAGARHVDASGGAGVCRVVRRDAGGR
jgi:hypothetical protein